MRLLIHKNYDEASYWAAFYISDKINSHFSNYKQGKPFVLGLPTGDSPRGIYKNLIRLNQEKKVSFKNVHTFNMDEYAGLDKDHLQSYRYFMMENLFNHIDIDKANINILNGTADNLETECREYEEKIKKIGGINLFLGGMGSDGHIAFNEPGSSLNSRTRIKTLTEETKIANSRFFNNDVSKVPSTALTVGVATIMEAEEVLIIVNGHHKARALKKVIEGSVNHNWTLSCLQMHPKAIIVCDEDAVDELQVKTVRYFKDIEKENLKNFYERIKN
jgi:glucosamine-6-phosphate deaminase